MLFSQVKISMIGFLSLLSYTYLLQCQMFGTGQYTENIKIFVIQFYFTISIRLVWMEDRCTYTVVFPALIVQYSTVYLKK